MGFDFSAFHAAECAANLPLGSSLFVKLAGQQLTTENMVHALLVGIVGGGKQKGMDGIETESVPLDEFIDWYENTKWKEVEEWQEIQ